MSKYTFILSDGDIEFLRLYSGADTWAEADMQVKDYDGFDNIPNITISTVPKLFGNGSYVTEKRLAERELKITAQVHQENVRAIRDIIATKAAALDPITVSRVILNDIITIDAYITSLDWTQTNDDEAEFILSLKSMDALIQSGTLPA